MIVFLLGLHRLCNVLNATRDLSNNQIGQVQSLTFENLPALTVMYVTLYSMDVYFNQQISFVCLQKTAEKRVDRTERWQFLCQ